MCLRKLHNINAYEAVELQTDAYLTSVLESGDLLDSNPRTFFLLLIEQEAGWVLNTVYSL